MPKGPTPPPLRRFSALLRRAPLAAALCLSLAASAQGRGERAQPTVPPPHGFVQTVAHASSARATQPRIVTPARRLQCVPFARELSHLNIRGDAWTWWAQAKGRYQRGDKPAVGAVLVLKRKGRSRGHLAVVTQVVSDREIIASHANWLNRGQIHMNTPIHDVSRNNDWSAVKIWYTPGNVLGRSAYPAYGFIYPSGQSAAK